MMMGPPLVPAKVRSLIFGGLAFLALLIGSTIAAGIAYHNYKVRRAKGNGHSRANCVWPLTSNTNKGPCDPIPSHKIFSCLLQETKAIIPPLSLFTFPCNKFHSWLPVSLAVTGTRTELCFAHVVACTHLRPASLTGI